MFAIIEDGGRQYRVQVGAKLEIDLRSDVAGGDSVRFDRILAAGDAASGKIGQPLISGAVVEAKIDVGRGALLLALADETAKLGLVFSDMHLAIRDLKKVL